MSSFLSGNPGIWRTIRPVFNGHWQDIGPAVVLIFWAYAGFELAPLPADEIKDAERTVPKALFTGMAIVILFYPTTKLVVYGMVKSPDLAKSMTPLTLVGTAIFGAFGAILMSVGALFSVSGSSQSAVLGTSRLAYAMAVDGQQVLPLLGILICLILIIYTSVLDKLVGLGFILVGIPIYYFFSDRQGGRKSNPSLATETSMFACTIEKQDNFLAHFLVHIVHLRKKQPVRKPIPSKKRRT